MNIKSLTLTSIIFLALYSFSCTDSGTSIADDNTQNPLGLNEGFGVLIDSSHFRLSYVHESHLNGSVSDLYYSNDVFWPMLDIDLYLNQPDTSSEIKKLLIFNEEGLGWEINRNELDDLFLNGTSKLELKNLQMNTSIVNYDQLFTVWFINDKNERSESYQFIIKGDLPFKVFTQNYWVSNDTLEFESSVRKDPYNYNIRGYDPVSDSDSISIHWLDNSSNTISSLDITPEEYVQSENESLYHLQTEPSSSEIAYSYPTFTQKRINSTYRLVGAIYPVLKRPGDNISIYKVAENSFRLLHHDDATTIIISQHPTQPNELSVLEVFSSSEPQKTLFQVDIKQSIYNNILNVYFDPTLKTVFYFDINSNLYSLDLTTGEEKQENEPPHFGNSYSERIFHYGDHLLIGKGSVTYLFHKETKEVTALNNFALGIDANSYYFSPIDSSLYAAENNRRFFKIKLPLAENDPPASIENFYNSYNSSLSYSNLLGLHFDSRDSLLIHSSGLVLSIKEGSSFTNNSILTLPNFRSPGSVWFDSERALVVMDESGSIKKQAYDGSSFSEDGTLDYFLQPFSIRSHHTDLSKFVLVNQYYQGYNRPRAAMLQTYSLDDFQTNTSNLKINIEYKAMSAVVY
jgi:hypothetical protein